MTQLRAAGAASDTALPLAETALLLGSLDLPGIDLEEYHRHLEHLSGDLAEIGAPEDDWTEQSKALAHVMTEVYGYDGDQLTFDDPYNANLVSVIDRRRGLPVTLGILYLHTGRAQGWAVNGLNFPGHFLVCVGEGADMCVVDPFHAGRILTEAEIAGYLQRVQGANAKVELGDLGTMTNRAILVRLLNNIKQRAQKGGDNTRALEISERLVMIAPSLPSVQYDYAVLNAQAGHLSLALDVLGELASSSAEEAMRAKAVSTLESVKRRLN